MWSVDRQGGLTKFSCRWSRRNVPERSPRAYGPPISLSLSSIRLPLFPPVLLLVRCVSTSRVPPSLPRSFVGRFSPRRLFLPHVRIKASFPRIAGFTLLSAPLSFPPSLSLSLPPLSLYHRLSLPPRVCSHQSLSLSRLLGVELIGDRSSWGPETARS